MSRTRSEPDVDDAGTVQLGIGGRTWRAIVMVAVMTLFILGSLIGNDHWWPFSPWRMFATATKPTGAVSVMAIEVQKSEDGKWTPVPINPWIMGVNRAEVEGQVPQTIDDPDRLGTLAETHSKLKPNEAEWVGVRMVRRSSVIEDGEPTGELRTTVQATWQKGGNP